MKLLFGLLYFVGAVLVVALAYAIERGWIK